jgi:hypothetical protein
MAKLNIVEAAPLTDTTRTPVLAVGFGRGFGGKSTLLMEIAQRAQNRGRYPIVGDFDARSKTLGDMFSDAVVPPTEELPDMKNIFSQLLNRMTKDRCSAVLDFGGGDRFMLEYGRDLQLVEYCEIFDIDPVAIYVLGPELEDLRHCLSIYEAGYFRPKRTILVCNEGVIREGRTVAGAFERTMQDPGFQRMVSDGAVPLLLPRLPCMDLVKGRRLSFYEASGELDPVEGFMLTKWIRGLEAKRVQLGIADWLP